jgi:hypothetical protein
MMVNPLRLGSIVPLLLQEYKLMRNTRVPANEMSSWLASANRLEQAHRQTVAWFRSRLPGYPLIRSPHLVAGSPLTTLEWTYRLIWTPDERKRGLQFQSAPDVAGMLGLEGSAATESERAAQAVMAALERTDEWSTFEEATRSLDTTGKADLLSARNHLAARLAPEAIDAHEPNLAIPRNEYRAHATRVAVENLKGSARAYVDAFSAANELIDTTTSEVFGQLMAYGDPLTISACGLDLLGGRPPRVAFSLAEHYVVCIGPGSLLRLDDPLVPDILRIDSLNVHVTLVDDAGLKAEAVLLENTAAAF